MEQNYCAFISYRHVSPDDTVAKALHTAIETYGIPGSIKKQTGKRKMGKVFRDQEELPLSADLGADIEAALDGSEWLICVCSPRYLESRWCLREVEYFLRRKGRDRILAVLVEGEPEDSFPELLRFDTLEDGTRVEREPLAADLRGADDGERRRKLKAEVQRLLAPMLGVSYDDLHRRARQRRIRQTAGICAAALVLAGAIGAYAASNHAKNERLRLEAEAQQALAEEQQALAEERKRLAEEEAQRAEEEARRAEEEKARAEEERIKAVSNSIGECLERAGAFLGEQNNRNAVRELLAALELSDGENGLRREEVVSLLRRSMYITPFAPISEFTGQNIRMVDIAAAPGGRYAAGIENNNSAALMDVETETVRYRVKAGNEMIYGVTFSPEGDRFLALCETGKLVVVWNTEDGSEAFRYVSRENKTGHIANARFWRDGKTLLVQDLDRFLLVSEDGTEKCIYTLGQQQDWYDPEYNLFTVIFEKPLSELFTTTVEDYTGTGMCVSADGSRILISGKDGSTGTLIINEKGEVVTPLWGMPATFAEKYTLSPDGRYAACVSYFGFLAWWDAESGELLNIEGFSSDGVFSSIVFSPDGTRMAAVLNNELRVYDPATEELLISGTMDATNTVPELCFSEDGKWIFLTNESLYIIDAGTGALYAMAPASFTDAYNNTVQVGDLLILTRVDGRTELLCMPELSNVTFPAKYAGELCPDYDPRVPPAGAKGLTLHGEHQLTEGFKASTALTDLSTKMFFSREGDRAVLYYPDGVMELFLTEGDGELYSQLGLLTREVSAFGMAGRYLAACDAGGRLLIYDLEEEAVVRILNLESPYTRFAFDETGTLLMGLRETGNLDVYSLPDAQHLFLLRSPETFQRFAFAADGSAAVGLTASGAVVGDLWTDEAALIQRARRLAG